jgi:plastocyanin
MRTFLSGLCALTFLVACSGDDTSTAKDSGTDTSTNKDTGVQETGGQDTGVQETGTQDAAVADVAVDTGPPTVNGCTTFTDATAPNAARAITFPTGVIPSQYSPNCLKIKVGQSVTWNGGFANHPLIASGGDSGNPITTTSTGTTKSFTFSAAGTYGFACQLHSLSMLGAIQVVQ